MTEMNILVQIILIGDYSCEEEKCLLSIEIP